jgi:predicted Zn-dependent peptidase
MLVHQKQTDQTHLVLGFHAFGGTDKRATTLSAITSILSSGMSSRLFKKLREDMGACYYVRASSNLWADYGDVTISTGIDKNRIEEVLNVLLSECKKLTTDLVTDAELNKTKEYMVSHLYMGLETTDSLSEFYALDEVSRRETISPDRIEREIRKITAKDIQKVAKDVFKNESLNLAIVGDLKNAARLKKLLVL